MNATRETWHAAGRAAGDDRKRFLALQGLLWTFPLLVVGSVLAHLPDPNWVGLKRPLLYVLEPLRSAWLADRDLALFGYLGLQLLLVALLWGLFGGAIHRLAAVDLARQPRESGRDALAFARRHWRGFVGSRVALWLGVAVPLLAVVLLATLGRLPLPFGALVLTVVVAAAVIAAIVSVLVLSIDLVAGFLSGPTIACEDSDAFDAVSRTFTYASANLPRLTWLRLLFFGGVLLGAGWRLVRTLAVAALAWLALRVGAGAAVLDGALAVLSATGTPPDAARLDLGFGHYVLATGLALAAGSLAILWLADFVSRVICARTGVYLLLRQQVDRVPLDRLRTASRSKAPLASKAAGFTEVGRVGDV